MDERGILDIMGKSLPSEMGILSLPNLTRKKSFNFFVEEQFNIQDSIGGKRGKAREKIAPETDSDEELKAELEEAVRIYKKNVKSERESYGNSETSKHETFPWQSPNIGSDSFRSKRNLNNERNPDGDPATDIMELINFFFSPRKSQDKKLEYSRSCLDYEKQGAIPKRGKLDKNNIGDTKGDTVRRGTKGIGTKSKSVGCQTNMRSKQMHVYDAIETLNEETCFGAFFYIVPENPSPKFFLPRGSYYVIPKVPTSSSEERIVFHPEEPPSFSCKRGNQRPREIQWSSLREPSKMNNLDKDVQVKVDSHLNIGPLDVKLNDSFTNLVTNSSGNKIYNKSLKGDYGFGSLEGVNDQGTEVFNNEAGSVVAVVGENPSQDENREKLDGIIQRLMFELPDLTMNVLKNLAEKYLQDELGLENFITSERLQRKINSQLDVLVAALPESSYSELRKKCEEIKGDEKLVREYIEEMKQEQRFHRRVLDLQLIFPNADFDFLRTAVRKLGDSDSEMNMLIEDLLERSDYPKISEDFSQDLKRRRLWMIYVKKFNVRDYIRRVPSPEVFLGPDRNNNEMDEDLIFKYLELRYRHAPRDVLRKTFMSENKSLYKTCLLLDLTQEIAPLDSSLEKEAFSEEFLKEICYVEHKKEIDKYCAEMLERKKIEMEEARWNSWFLTCLVCSDDELLSSEVVTCPEGHIFCKECVERYVFIKMGDGMYKFVCPAEECEAFFTLSTLESFLCEEVVFNICKKQQAEEVITAEVDGLESCPYCEFSYIPNAEDKIFKCQNPYCLVETCRKCGEKNHIPLRCEEVERPVDIEARKKVEETMSEKLMRVCPSCKKKIVKIDGCNKMSCPCGTLFCYCCGSRIKAYDHFGLATCPLFSNNEDLHIRDVIRAGIQARNEILMQNPGVRILYDPTEE